MVTLSVARLTALLLLLIRLLLAIRRIWILPCRRLRSGIRGTRHLHTLSLLSATIPPAAIALA